MTDVVLDRSTSAPPTAAQFPQSASQTRLSAGVSFAAGILCLLLPIVAGVLVLLAAGLGILAVGALAFDVARRLPVGTRGRWRALFEAVAVLVVGATFLFAPVFGSAVVTAAVGIPALLVGISRIAAAIELRPRSDATSALAFGIAIALLGVAVLLGWPFSGAIVAGVLLGFAFLADGAQRWKAARALAVGR